MIHAENERPTTNALGGIAYPLPMGQRLGNEYLEFVGSHPTLGNANPLGWIVTDMARTLDHKGKIDASALGFLKVVND